MNIFKVYVPIKDIKYSYIKGKGYTSKGKHYISYIIDKDGKKVSTWVLKAGGVNAIIETIKKLIDLNYDYLPISRIFNISPTTCINFIKKNLSIEYIEKERKIFKNNSKLRRVLALKGKPKKTKGKTYLEIYGTLEPGCGFKKGDKNPNFTRDKYVGRKCVSSSGKKFRSLYEVRFSEMLEKHHIAFEYEHHFKLLNGKVKIVDFIVNDKLVEVTGYAYDKWKNDFDIKISLLNQTYRDKKIIIVSTANNVNELRKKHGEYAKILNIENEEEMVSEFIL